MTDGARQDDASARGSRISKLELQVLSSAPPPCVLEVGARQTRPLRLATGVIEPFVVKRGNQLAVFSVDLWSEIARRMRVDFVWVEAGLRDEQMATMRRCDPTLSFLRAW